jgi:hypothetical protein
VRAKDFLGPPVCQTLMQEQEKQRGLETQSMPRRAIRNFFYSL